MPDSKTDLADLPGLEEIIPKRVVYTVPMMDQVKVRKNLIYVQQIAPIFVARAGLDNPLLNESIERFIHEAVSKNVLIDFCNHPGAATDSTCWMTTTDRARSSGTPSTSSKPTHSPFVPQ